MWERLFYTVCVQLFLANEEIWGLTPARKDEELKKIGGLYSPILPRFAYHVTASFPRSTPLQCSCNQWESSILWLAWDRLPSRTFCILIANVAYVRGHTHDMADLPAACCNKASGVFLLGKTHCFAAVIDGRLPYSRFFASFTIFVGSKCSVLEP